MRKFITALLIAIWLHFIFLPVKVKAAIVFSDSFLEGYDQSAWRLDSNSSVPVATLFGIGGENTTSTYSLWSTTSPPLDAIIKADLKINSIPSHTLLGCKGIDAGSENRVIFYGVSDIPSNLIGTWKLASFVNGSGTGGSSGNWDMTTGVHHLELDCIGNIMTVKEDGNTLGSWDVTGHNNFTATTVRFQYWFGDSEYANYKLCDGNGCEGPPATPSPTPTNSPTPTPTPTPPPTTKVVVIPGLGASWNIASLLSCGLLDIGEWGLNPLAEGIYNPLLSTLASAGYTPLPYYYDWRKVVVSNNSKLTNFIEGQIGDNERVHLIGHSMGGLVGRSYLETATENAKLEKLLTVGSPHQGAVLAYPAWSAGEAWIDNFLWRFATTFVLKHCGGLAGNDRETIRSLIPSVQNLLPTADYLRDHTTGNLKPISFMNAQNNWLPTGSFPPFWGVTVGTLSGTNEKTLSVLEVKDPTKHDKKLGDWLDGKPMQKEMSLDGDDTVLLSSSQVPGASTNVAIPSSHNTLVNSAQGLTEIFNFLGTAPSGLSAVAYEEPTSALILMSYPAVFWVTDPDGTIRQDKSGIVAFTNPKKGTYKFFLQPKKFSTDIIVAQFLANGKTLWKEYKHNSLLPKFASLSFDPAKPLEDILK